MQAGFRPHLGWGLWGPSVLGLGRVEVCGGWQGIEPQRRGQFLPSLKVDLLSALLPGRRHWPGFLDPQMVLETMLLGGRIHTVEQTGRGHDGLMV